MTDMDDMTVRGSEGNYPMEALDRPAWHPARQCTATSRSGERCQRQPIPGGTVCVMHGGAVPHVQAAAKARLIAMDDDERAQRDAELKALRDAFNAMHVKGSADGSTLVAYTKDGDALDASEMTELQRRAFARMDALQRR